MQLEDNNDLQLTWAREKRTEEHGTQFKRLCDCLVPILGVLVAVYDVFFDVVAAGSSLCLDPLCTLVM